jgi:hypothetical protein
MRDTWEGSKAGGVCARRLGLGPGPFHAAPAVPGAAAREVNLWER